MVNHYYKHYIIIITASIYKTTIMCIGSREFYYYPFNMHQETLPHKLTAPYWEEISYCMAFIGSIDFHVNFFILLSRTMFPFINKFIILQEVLIETVILNEVL